MLLDHPAQKTAHAGESETASIEHHLLRFFTTDRTSRRSCVLKAHGQCMHESLYSTLPLSCETHGKLEVASAAMKLYRNASCMQLTIG
jgi:hypothetical protein